MQEQNKLKDEIASLNKTIASRDAERASEKAAADATIKKHTAEIQELKEAMEKEADAKAEIASSNSALEVQTRWYQMCLLILIAYVRPKSRS